MGFNWPGYRTQKDRRTDLDVGTRDGLGDIRELLETLQCSALHANKTASVLGRGTVAPSNLRRFVS